MLREKASFVGKRVVDEATVCYWHKADMLNALTNVRYRG
jgi:hypothetical protein